MEKILRKLAGLYDESKIGIGGTEKKLGGNIKRRGVYGSNIYPSGSLKIKRIFLRAGLIFALVFFLSLLRAVEVNNGWIPTLITIGTFFYFWRFTDKIYSPAKEEKNLDENKKSASAIKWGVGKKVGMLFLLCLILSLIFYWHELRPKEIKKECNSRALKESITVKNGNKAGIDEEKYRLIFDLCIRNRGL